MKNVLQWLIEGAILLGLLVAGSYIEHQRIMQHDNRFPAALSRRQLSEALRELLALVKYKAYEKRSLRLARDFWKTVNREEAPVWCDLRDLTERVVGPFMSMKDA